jgi:general L-amino acid transport system permease protein
MRRRCAERDDRGPPEIMRSNKTTMLWRSERARRVAWQMLFYVGLGAIIWYFSLNLISNLTARHIATGFGFLDQAAPVPIGESLITYTPSVSTYGRALVVGLLNTVKVALPGIVLATLLGTIVGTARLSTNWLAARLSATYVECLRNTPLLLQLFIWYGALQALPPPRTALVVGQGVFLSNRGLVFPALQLGASGPVIAGCVVLAILLFAGLRRTRLRAFAVPAMILPIIYLLTSASLDTPQLRGFNFRGGALVSPEFCAILAGVTVYTSSYIAEIVRAGILSVAQGQWEAAAALGMNRGTILRSVIYPQALRVVVPPLASEFLNLTKNTSLAVAIGYPDLLSVADTTLNQTGQSIETMALVIVTFLAISLVITGFMNWYNTHTAFRRS